MNFSVQCREKTEISSAFIYKLSHEQNIKPIQLNENENIVSWNIFIVKKSLASLKS